MDFTEAFLAGQTDLESFLSKFCLDRVALLSVLAKTHSVLTGSDFVLFLAGKWLEMLRERPHAPVLEILFSGDSARQALEKFLVSSGYRTNPHRCCHQLGEWFRFHPGVVICYVRGELSMRVVHLVGLRCAVQQTLLSRVYGSMVGNYLTGAGQAVSLFPHLTFAEKRYWVSSTVKESLDVQLRRKYPGWTRVEELGGAEAELGGAARLPTDSFAWSLKFGPNGEFVEARKPTGDR